MCFIAFALVEYELYQLNHDDNDDAEFSMIDICYWFP